MKNFIAAAMIAAIPSLALAQGFIPKGENCGILWGNADFNQMAGPHPGVYVLGNNTRHEKFGKSFNDKVSAAAVKEGCTLTLYLHDYFRVPLQIIEGPAILTNSNGTLHHNDDASSAECICEEFIDEF